MTIVPRKRKDGRTSYGVKVWRNGREVWVGTRSSRPAAKQLEREEEASPRDCSEELIADFAARWPTDYARPAKQTNDRNRYQAKHLAAEYGHVQLGAFTRAQARAFAKQRPWAAQVARMLFQDALTDDLVAFNPFDRLSLPRGRGRRDAEVPGREDLDALCAAALTALGPEYGAHFAAAMRFSFYVGPRAGELFALHLADVDLEAGLVHIRRSRSGSSYKLPKSGKERPVVLGPQAVAALAAAARHAPAPRDADAAAFVFLGPKGGPFSKQSHHKLWTKVRGHLEAGSSWTEMPWHLWRHACATFLLDHVRPRLSHDDVAQHLGHKDASLILQLYGHPSQRLAQDRIRQALADPDW